MIPAHATQVCETAATIWPNIKVSDQTCRAWFLALADTNFYDAQTAIGNLARHRKTIHVSDIVREADRVKSELLRSLPPAPEPPSELADDPRAFIQWQRTARERQLWAARNISEPVSA